MDADSWYYDVVRSTEDRKLNQHSVPSAFQKAARVRREQVYLKKVSECGIIKSTRVVLVDGGTPDAVWSCACDRLHGHFKEQEHPHLRLRTSVGAETHLTSGHT